MFVMTNDHCQRCVLFFEILDIRQAFNDSPGQTKKPQENNVLNLKENTMRTQLWMALVLLTVVLFCECKGPTSNKHNDKNNKKSNDENTDKSNDKNTDKHKEKSNDKNKEKSNDENTDKSKEKSKSPSKKSSSEKSPESSTSEDSEQVPSSPGVEKHCMKDGFTFAIGQFDDPSDKCRLCKCFESGKISCKPRECQKKECGKKFQILPKGECCPVCNKSSCETVKCAEVKCASRLHFFGDESCCPECGCRYMRKLVPEGQVGDKCDECVCSSGRVKCQPKCPAQKLQCVDAVWDEHCNTVCPQGKTCSIGNTVIRYGEYKTVGRKICTCQGDWFPNAFCAKKKVPRQMSKCVAEAVVPETS